MIPETNGSIGRLISGFAKFSKKKKTQILENNPILTSTQYTDTSRFCNKATSQNFTSQTQEHVSI